VRPILKRYGFGATFFITEGFSFRTNKQDYMTWEQIAELHRDGTTIFLVEQNAHMALRVAQHFFLMEQGRVSFSGDPGALAEDEVIRRAYLGSAG
jgi:ABC-type branched-subunit amino acid transport system ATPase component